MPKILSKNHVKLTVAERRRRDLFSESFHAVFENGTKRRKGTLQRVSKRGCPVTKDCLLRLHMLPLLYYKIQVYIYAYTKNVRGIVNLKNRKCPVFS